MEVIFSSPEEKTKIMWSFSKILNNNFLLTLSTANKNHPFSSTAFYVFDKQFNLYIWTGKDTLHSKNIDLNQKIAINIYNSKQIWGSDLNGLQALGIASVTGAKDLLMAGALYLKRYPKAYKFAKNPKDFHSKALESRIYKIQLNKIKIFDEKAFGKEGFREIFIKRK